MEILKVKDEMVEDLKSRNLNRNQELMEYKIKCEKQLAL